MYINLEFTCTGCICISLARSNNNWEKLIFALNQHFLQFCGILWPMARTISYRSWLIFNLFGLLVRLGCFFTTIMSKLCAPTSGTGCIDLFFGINQYFALFRLLQINHVSNSLERWLFFTPCGYLS